MKKIFLKFHLWLAVPFGIIITIICFTGSMLVFEPEIVNVLRHDQIYVDNPRHTALSVDEIVRKVEQTLPSDVKVTGVTMYSDPNLSCKVNLSKPRRAAMYVDQYTGQLKGLYERPAFFDFMQRLHRWLLDSRDDSGGVFWGRTIVGISTIMCAVVGSSHLVAAHCPHAAQQPEDNHVKEPPSAVAQSSCGRRNVCADSVARHGADRTYMVVHMVQQGLQCAVRCQ